MSGSQAKTVTSVCTESALLTQALGKVGKFDEWNPVRTVVKPQEQTREIYDAPYEDYRKLYEATADIQHRLANIQNR